MKKVEFKYYSQEDIMSLGISFGEIIEIVEKALVSHSKKAIEMPPKPGIHTRDLSFIHAMPAWISDQDICGIKWVSGYPGNREYDLPQIAGLMIMNDSETGLPQAVMDCRWITAVRTAAVTAITAKYCGNKDSEALTVVGTGVQGTMNALMLNEVMPQLKKVYAHDLNTKSLEMFKETMERKTNLEVVFGKELEDSVRDSDLVLTATQRLPKPIIPYEWLKEGVCAFGLEACRAWHKDVIENIDAFITDDWGQTNYFIEHGAFPAVPVLYSELGNIVNGEKPGRENAKDKVLAINIGMAIDDIAVGSVVVKRAKEKGIGQTLSLMENEKMI